MPEYTAVSSAGDGASLTASLNLASVRGVAPVGVSDFTVGSCLAPHAVRVGAVRLTVASKHHNNKTSFAFGVSFRVTGQDIVANAALVEQALYGGLFFPRTLRKLVQKQDAIDRLVRANTRPYVGQRPPLYAIHNYGETREVENVIVVDAPLEKSRLRTVRDVAPFGSSAEYPGNAALNYLGLAHAGSAPDHCGRIGKTEA